LCGWFPLFCERAVGGVDGKVALVVSVRNTSGIWWSGVFRHRRKNGFTWEGMGKREKWDGTLVWFGLCWVEILMEDVRVWDFCQWGAGMGKMVVDASSAVPLLLGTDPEV